VLGLIVADYVRRTAALLEKTDVMCPGPPDAARYAERGFSIPLLVVETLAKRLAVPSFEDLLRVTQTGVELRRLAAWERAQAVKGLYVVNDRYDISGLRITIVDDIVTYGDTSKEIARVLKDAGAASVYALALGHTERSFG